MSPSPSEAPAPNELYRLLMENVRDYAIFTTDPYNRITTWNEGAERIFGYRADEVLGQDAALIFTPEDRAMGAVEVELTRAEETGRAENERWHVK